MSELGEVEAGMESPGPRLVVSSDERAIALESGFHPRMSLPRRLLLGLNTGFKQASYPIFTSKRGYAPFQKPIIEVRCFPRGQSTGTEPLVECAVSRVPVRGHHRSSNVMTVAGRGSRGPTA